MAMRSPPATQSGSWRIVALLVACAVVVFVTVDRSNVPRLDHRPSTSAAVLNPASDQTTWAVGDVAKGNSGGDAVSGEGASSRVSSSSSSSSSSNSNDPPGGRLEMFGAAEVVWYPPTQPAVGTLFVAHGCSHGAVDWMRRSEACPGCLGLPEELNITRVALSRGLAVVAVSSAARSTHRCWNVGSESDDVKQVTAVLQQLRAREGLEKLPLYALGASSGGAFALALAAEMKLDAVCSEIMALPGLGAMAQAAKSKFGSYPPTVFVHMPKDSSTAHYVGKNVQDLKEQRVITKVIEVPPTPITPEWLSHKLPELQEHCKLPPEQAAAPAIVEAFKAAGIIDAAGNLQSDPRQNRWREAVSKVPGCEALPTGPDVSGISEVLNVAWAAHEITSDQIGEVIDFFEAAHEYA